MAIRRIDVSTGPGPRMSRVAIHDDRVFLAGLTASDASQDVQGQTRQILERIDHYLHEAGTSKAKLLTANLWIKDMALFLQKTLSGGRSHGPLRRRPFGRR